MSEETEADLYIPLVEDGLTGNGPEVELERGESRNEFRVDECKDEFWDPDKVDCTLGNEIDEDDKDPFKGEEEDGQLRSLSVPPSGGREPGLRSRSVPPGGGRLPGERSRSVPPC